MTTAIPEISHLSLEQKRRLLDALVSDLASAELENSDVVSNRREAENDIRNATPEYMAELQRRAATPDDSFTIEEFLERVNSRNK